MQITRETVIASGEAAALEAAREVNRVASMSHGELVLEKIRAAIVAVDVHRHNCKFVGELLPEIEPIRNDDLAGMLRLRLELVAAYDYWNQ